MYEYVYSFIHSFMFRPDDDLFDDDNYDTNISITKLNWQKLETDVKELCRVVSCHVPMNALDFRLHFHMFVWCCCCLQLSMSI